MEWSAGRSQAYRLAASACKSHTGYGEKRTDKQNYLPLPVQPRLTTLHRKRKEYSQLVDQYFGRGLASLDQQVRP